MTTTKAVILAVVATVAASLLFGQTGSSASGQDWEMFAQRVAGTGGAGGSAGAGWPGERVYSDVFLYNKRTGKVYMHFGQCTSSGRELDGGCFASLAVFGDDPNVDVVPTPMNRDRGGRAY